MREAFESLDHIRLNFDQGGLLILNITLAIIMFGVALGIKLDDFKQIIASPKPVISGYISQFFLLPLVTFLFALALNPSPGLALGLILVAACPGGNISNFISSYAKGNVALSVMLTAISTLTAIFVTPFNFAFWGGLYVKFYNRMGESLLRPLEIDMVQMFQTVFILLGIPVILGILFSTYFPRATEKLKKWIQNISIIVFFAMVIILLLKNIEHFSASVHIVLIIVIIHNSLAISTGYFFGKLMHLKVKDIRTIAIETGIQNSGLALTLIFNPKIFPPDLELGGMAIVAAWWGIYHIISGLTVAYFWNRKQVEEDL